MKTFTKKELIQFMVNDLGGQCSVEIQEASIKKAMKRMSEDAVLEEVKMTGVEFMKVGNNQYQVVPKNYTPTSKPKSREFNGYKTIGD